MERIQKVNNPEPPSTDDLLPFSFEPSRITTAATPPKRVSTTNSDSGVNSPQEFSPRMPVTLDNLHSYKPFFMPPTSRIGPLPDSPNRALTPIQQFINNSRNFRNKELQYNGSQPDYLDPQPVLCTRTRQGFKL